MFKYRSIHYYSLEEITMSIASLMKCVFIGGITFLLCSTAFGWGSFLDAEKQEKRTEDQILWWYPLDAPSFGSSAVDDIDEDGFLEIVFGTYFNDEHVYALNAEDGSLLWSYDTGGCNDASPVIADVDLDGHLDVVIPASSPSIVYCFDGMTGAVKWSRSTGASNCIDSPPAVADVDNDEKQEILLGTFFGNIFCLNGEDGSINWQKNLGADSYIQSEPAVLDLNDDGQLDVVVAQFDGDCRMYALWGNNGTTLWYSDLPTDSMYHGCSFADLDQDEKPELVIGSYDNHLYIFNGEDGSLAWQYIAPYYIGAPTSIGDLNNDGYYEIICTSYNILRVFSHTGAVLWSVTTGGDLFRGAALSDIDGDGVLDVVFGSYDGILRAVRGNNGQSIWAFDLQAHYGMYFEIGHAPVIADFNNDGKLDVFVVGGYGVYPPDDNHGRAYALTAGDGSGPGWPMFRHDCRHSGCFPLASNQPPSMGTLTGPVYGRPGVNYTFCVTVTDPEGDDVFILWDWGDGTYSSWLGPYASGEEACAMHAWANEGIYSVRVKFRDEHGAESEWSDPFLVYIDGTPPTLEIVTPQQGFLYIFGKQVRPSFSTVVFGRIPVEVLSVDNTSGVSYVQFFIDGALKKNLSTSPYTWVWRQPSFSRHILNVTAYDHAGNFASTQMDVWKFF
jgi:outer membrane protein assembly factor BamB